jgi:hypothetical protein
MYFFMILFFIFYFLYVSKYIYPKKERVDLVLVEQKYYMAITVPWKELR